MQTKEQQRSEFALVKIKGFGFPVKKDVANFVVGVPTLVLENGLGQTLAFLLSKQKQDHTTICNILRDWLGQEIQALQTKDNFSFLQKLAGLEQHTYLRAQQEAMALLQWLKRYARAFQEEKKQEDKNS